MEKCLLFVGCRRQQPNATYHNDYNAQKTAASLKLDDVMVEQSTRSAQRINFKSLIEAEWSRNYTKTPEMANIVEKQHGKSFARNRYDHQSERKPSSWWVPRMKSATQDWYWPDRLGPRRGGSGATQLIGLEKVWVTPFRLANTKISVFLVRPIPISRSGRARHYPYFGLFDLCHARISVCLVWPLPIFWSVWSGQFPNSSSRGPAKRIAAPLQIL